jgi:PAS domain S-box-containing protein
MTDATTRAPTTRHATSGGPTRILLIEDNPGDAQLVEELVTEGLQAGEVRRARDLASGLAAAEEERPDVAVVDLGLPDSEGAEAVERIAGAVPDLPIVVLTRKEERRAVRHALEAGATGYLQKSELSPGLLARTLWWAQGRKSREREFRRKERRYQAIFEDPSMLAGLLAPDGTLLEVNETAMDYIRADRAAVLGQPFWETPWWEPEQEALLREKIMQAASGEYARFEVEHVLPGGEVRTVAGTIRPVTDPSGTVVSLVISSRDITERKRHEQVLEERQEKVKALYGATEHLLTADSDEAVADRIQDLLNRAFDFPIMGVSFVEEGTIVPERTAMKEGYEMPPVQPLEVEGGSLGAQSLRAGEPVVVEDLSSVENEVDYGDVASAACIPIGERGVLYLGRVEAASFPPFDLRLLDILAAHARVVLNRLQHEEELLEAKEEAEDAARLKSSMLANMSHEIRTPLTSITGFSEMLRAHLDGALETFASKIHGSSRRLQRTLDSVLQLSRLEAGVEELKRETVPLGQVAEEVEETLGGQAEDKSIALAADVPAATVPCYGNEDAIYRICRNLLENAIKFTPEGGDVKARIERAADEVILEVEDTGIGMAPSETDRLFEAFEQASRGRNREYEGTGLGLSIVKRLTEAHGGTVEVETEEGEGTRFAVRLPKTGSGETSDG